MRAANLMGYLRCLPQFLPDLPMAALKLYAHRGPRFGLSNHPQLGHALNDRQHSQMLRLPRLISASS